MGCVLGATLLAAAPGLRLRGPRAIVLKPRELLSQIAKHWNSLGSQTRREISEDSIPLPGERRDGLARDRSRGRRRAAVSNPSIRAIAALHSLYRLPPAVRCRAH